MVEEIEKEDNDDEEVNTEEGQIVEEKKEKASILYLLPKSILLQLNDAIDKDAKIAELQAFLRERYKGKLKVHSGYLVKQYITQYKQEKENNINATEILRTTGEFKALSSDTLQSIGKNKTWNLDNKKEILEDLVFECRSRLLRLKSLPNFQQGPGTEKAIAQYITEIREIIKTIAEISGDLNTEQGNTTINILNSNLYSIMAVVAKTIKQIYGDDKLIIFKESLKENFIKQNSELNIIDALTPGENNGQKPGNAKEEDTQKEKDYGYEQLKFEECK